MMMSVRDIHAARARGEQVEVREGNSDRWLRVYSSLGDTLYISDNGRVRRHSTGMSPQRARIVR